MTINRKFATLGAILFVIPFLGVPDSWKSVLICLLSLAVIFTAIDFSGLGKHKKKNGRRKTDKLKMTETFAENNSFRIKTIKPIASPSYTNPEAGDEEPPL